MDDYWYEYDRSYTYYDQASGGQTTLLPKVTYTGLYDSTGAAKAVSYTHAFNTGGYLTKVTEADNTYWAYSYDKQGQLKYATEYDSTSTAQKRYKYTYDNVGNITSWVINNDDNSETYESHTYTYGDANWVDLLTAFDGQTITYDYAGNPTSYYNGTRWLVSASSTGNTISYTYDANSLRTSKTVNGTIHSYLYAGGKLLQESTPSYTLYFTYQSDGTPYSMTHVTDTASATYYYIVNLQGDVMYLIDSSSKIVATYTYDPYGKVLTAEGTVAEINPLRYRGYYYDAETGFYYLQSRYYDPAICRFINADGFASTATGFLGYNMFTYCNNDPIDYTDSEGNVPVWYYLILEAKMGFIHQSVERHIITHNSGVQGEVWLTRDGEISGRADLVRGNSVWEIKHAANSPGERTVAAAAQAISYLGSTTIRTKELVTTLGEAGAFSGTFPIAVYDSAYEVSYTTPAPGAVLYTVKETTQQGSPWYSLAPSPIRSKSNLGHPTTAVAAGLGLGVVYALCRGGRTQSNLASFKY